MGRRAKMLWLWVIPSLATGVYTLLPWWAAAAASVCCATIWHKVYCMEERP